MNFIKLLSYSVCIIVFTISINGQSNAEFQKKFEAANQLLDQKQYEIAKDLWIELAEEYPDNANVNYKTGYCLLNTFFQKSDALLYLSKAERNIKGKYSPIDYTVKNAPLETHYHLAHAFHHNYQIDSAIKYYRYFQNEGPKKHYLQSNIVKNLKQCNVASALITHKKDYEMVNLGAKINSGFPDYNPCLTLDENTLFFTSKRTRTEDVTYQNATIFNPQDGQHFEDIYVTHRDIKTNEWSTPKLLDFCTANESQATIGISGDGEKLFVYQSKLESDEEIYYTSRDQDYYRVKPLNIFNSASWENHVTISADEKILFFVSDRPGGLGGTDIWRCVKLPNGEWSKPFNIGPPVNSPYNEQSPFMHPDGKTLYFSSDGEKSMGGYDIFFSKKMEENSWSNPINMGFPLNTVDDDLFFTTSVDGARGYYASNHDGGYGGNDLYMVKLKNTITDPVSILKGYVDKGNNPFLPDGITIWVHEVGSDIEPMKFTPNKNNGSYIFTLDPCKEYDVEYTKSELNPNNELIEKSFFNQSFKVPCESDYKRLQKPIIIPGIDLEGNIIYEEEKKLKDDLINDQPLIQLSLLSSSSKKLIKLTVIDENGNVIQEAILTEDGFKFVLLDDRDQYTFKLSNFPENLDLSDIPIEIFTENNEVKLIGDFSKNQSVTYKVNKLESKGKNLSEGGIYFEKSFGYNQKPSSVSTKNLNLFLKQIEEIIIKSGSVHIEIIGSASRVPTKSYSSNIELAKKRVEDVKTMLFHLTNSHKINNSQVKITKELHIVDGPAYKNDAYNKSKYGKYQYIRILAKSP